MYIENLSVSLCSLCEELNLSYREAARLCGVSYSCFLNILKGKSTPLLKTLENICERISCTPDEILISGKLITSNNYRLPLAITKIRRYRTAYSTTDYPLCPRCNTAIEINYQRYCSNCGQCLSWKCKTIEVIAVE